MQFEDSGDRRPFLLCDETEVLVLVGEEDKANSEDLSSIKTMTLGQLRDYILFPEKYKIGGLEQ